MWEEKWHYSGFPGLGEYVQMEVQCCYTARYQGIVCEIDYDGFAITPTPKMCPDAELVRWRRPKQPSVETPEKVEEYA